MARTTETLVKQIIEVDTLNVPSLVPFIDTANMLVTKHCAPGGASDEELELIERWLAAHFYAIRDPRIASESVSGISASYQNRLGLFLASTMYGQQAIMVDSSGALAKLNKDAEMGRKPGQVASVSWAGKDREDCTCP
jgi:hypothetical protein